MTTFNQRITAALVASAFAVGLAASPAAFAADAMHKGMKKHDAMHGSMKKHDAMKKDAAPDAQ